MTSRGPRRRSLGPCVGLAALVLTAGCSSGPGGAQGVDDEPGGSSGATSSSPTPVPVPDTPVVEPADGKLIKVPGASMHALPTYKQLNDFGVVQGWNDGQSAVTFRPDVNRAKSLDAFANRWIRQNGGPQVQVRQDDAVAGGKYRAWHVVDTTSDPVEVEHTFGILFLESAWLISITIYREGFPEPLTEEEADEVIASLLASFKTDLD